MLAVSRIPYGRPPTPHHQRQCWRPGRVRARSITCCCARSCPSSTPTREVEPVNTCYVVDRESACGPPRSTPNTPPRSHEPSAPPPTRSAPDSPPRRYSRHSPAPFWASPEVSHCSPPSRATPTRRRTRRSARGRRAQNHPRPPRRPPPCGRNPPIRACLTLAAAVAPGGAAHIRLVIMCSPARPSSDERAPA
jgi:hypothetical protein